MFQEWLDSMSDQFPEGVGFTFEELRKVSGHGVHSLRSRIRWAQNHGFLKLVKVYRKNVLGVNRPTWLYQFEKEGNDEKASKVGKVGQEIS